MVFDNPAVPKGSTVLVTGVNGFLGSHVADQFLRNGYKVRGTVRDTEKSAWVQEAFARQYGAGQFELVAVPAMEANGAFDQAVKGKTSSNLGRKIVSLTWPQGSASSCIRQPS
jgi:nucleoside-diphosphate-sugar epimerase